MTKKEKIFQLTLIVILIIISILTIPKINIKIKEAKINKTNTETIKEAKKFTPSIDKNKIIKNSAYLNVQFICQAPLETSKNWKIHEESCEEAALLQAYIYETNNKITKEEANQTIIDMIQWEEKNMGSHHDLYAEEFKKFASKFYNIKSNKIKIIKNANLNDIKKNISQGHPVIVGVDSTELNNPYYKYEGYHMLIVKGYTKDKIITNDNGTRKGKDFSYDNEIFKKAMKNSEGSIIIINLQEN